MDATQRLKQAAQEFTRIVEDLGRRIEEDGGGRPDLRTVELAVREGLQRVGHAAMAGLVEAYGSGRTGNRHSCCCGSQARFKAVNARQVTDLYGGVLQLRRAYFFCDECGQGVLPLDQELGLDPEELTPALANVVEMLVAIATFEGAARVVEQTLGVQISGERVRR